MAQVLALPRRPTRLSTFRVDLWAPAAAILVRALFFLYTRFTADDAYITFRYAENLARGLGFVYNRGEHVLGTTTPLFTLLLAGFGAVGVSIPAAAFGVLLLASGATAWLLLRMARDVGFGAFAWLPPFLYILWPRSLTGDTCGMESALFTALVMGAFVARSHRRLGTAFTLAALATLTRPEGVLLLGFLGAHQLFVVWRTRQGPMALLRRAAPALIILGAWTIYSWKTFGSPVPHSIPAKLALYSRVLREPFSVNLVWILAWHLAVGWIHTAAAVLGGYWLLRRRGTGGLEIAWLVAMILFFALSPTHLFFWYVVPLYPVYLLLGAGAVPFLAGEITAVASRPRVTRAALLALSGVVLSAGIMSQARHYRAEQECTETVHKAIGLYLAQAAAPEDVVAVGDIGYTGYYAQRQILDRGGLVSPAALPYNKEGDYLGLILDHKPAWVVAPLVSPTSNFLDDPLFTQRYERVRLFTYADKVAYAVWRRRAPRDP